VLENSGCPVPSYLLKLKKSQRRKEKSSFLPPKRKHISHISKHKSQVEKARQRLKVSKKSAKKGCKAESGTDHSATTTKTTTGAHKKGEIGNEPHAVNGLQDASTKVAHHLKSANRAPGSPPISSSKTSGGKTKKKKINNKNKMSSHHRQSGEGKPSSNKKIKRASNKKE